MGTREFADVGALGLPQIRKRLHIRGESRPGAKRAQVKRMMASDSKEVSAWSQYASYLRSCVIYGGQDDACKEKELDEKEKKKKRKEMGWLSGISKTKARRVTPPVVDSHDTTLTQEHSLKEKYQGDTTLNPP